MSAVLITVCNQKGGAGKSTVTLNLAGALGRRGYKVGVVDGDEQESLVEIISLAPENDRLPATVFGLGKAGPRLHLALQGHMDHYDIILIDTQPSAESSLVKSALLVSDLALIPFIPATNDAVAAPKIRELIESIQLINPNLQARVLLNRLEKGWLITQEIIKVVLPRFNIPTLSSVFSKRAPYVECSSIGNSVHALKDRKDKIEPAIQEVENLTDEILGLLKLEMERHNEKTP